MPAPTSCKRIKDAAWTIHWELWKLPFPSSFPSGVLSLRVDSYKQEEVVRAPFPNVRSHSMLIVWVGPHTNLGAKTRWGHLSEVEYMVIMGSEFPHSAPGLASAPALFFLSFYPFSVNYSILSSFLASTSASLYSGSKLSSTTFFCSLQHTVLQTFGIQSHLQSL